jgi:hypothetical protein
VVVVGMCLRSDRDHTLLHAQVETKGLFIAVGCSHYMTSADAHLW